MEKNEKRRGTKKVKKRKPETDMSTKVKRKSKKCKRYVEEVQVVSWSPSGDYLAAGSRDNHIYIFETKQMVLTNICRGHTSFVTHLDWSIDGSVLRSNDGGSYEILENSKN